MVFVAPAGGGGVALRQQSGFLIRQKPVALAGADAEPPALDPAQSGEAALRQIGLAYLDTIAGNEAAVLGGIEQGMHQMRVVVRRLRAMLSAFRQLLPENQRRWASEELRWLAGVLGPVRNLDVFEAMVLQPIPQDVAGSGARETLRRALQRQRRTAYRNAAQAMRSPRYTALVQHLARWFETCGWRTGHSAGGREQPTGVIAREALQRRWRAAKKHGKGFSRQSPGQRHRLRIALKKLRYTAEPLAALYPGDRAEPFIRQVKRLQDDLGHANDVRVGHDIVAALAGGDAGLLETGERLLGGHDKRVARSEPKLKKRLHKLFETEPFWRL